MPPPDDLAGPGPGEELAATVTGALDGLPVQSAVAGAADPQDATDLLAMFEAQALSRWLDVAAARLAAAGIAPRLPASAGHEANAALGLAVRPGDPVLAHYRSGALIQARAARRHPVGPGRDAVVDAALGLRGARDHAGAHGRYPLAADPRLDIAVMGTGPAEHLPRALGVAWSLGRQAQLPRRHRTALRWPDDAVVVATFGDGAVNRASTLAALNAVSWATDQGAPLPLLMVCEDNGLSGGARSAPGWVRSVLDGRAGLEYLPANGSDPVGMLAAARWAVETVRLRREPVVLHVSCAPIGVENSRPGRPVGSRSIGPAEDAPPSEGARPSADARPSDGTRPGRAGGARATAGAHATPAREGDDPLVATAFALVVRGIADAATVRDLWQGARERVASAVAEATRRPTPSTTLEVNTSVLGHRVAEVARSATGFAPEEERKRAFGGTLPEDEGRLTLAESINRALTDAALSRPGIVLLGPGAARQGGAYGVTAGLQRRIGASRVIDTLADDETVVGLALGAGTTGLLPVAEPGPLGRFLGTEAQIRGQAAAASFYSAGAFGAAAVLRVPGLTPSLEDGGWPGFAPDDLALGGLRDLPGVVVACLAHPSDAPSMLRTCLAGAEDSGRTCIVIEPLALYHERDLVKPGDGGWASSYTPPQRWDTEHAEIGRASVWGEGEHLTIAAYGNGMRMALRVASRLAHEGIGARVVDLRWLSPLPMEDVVREATATGRLLVVDELRRAAGVSAAIVTAALEAGFTGRIARVVAGESPIPGSPAAELALLSEASVEAAARMLLDRTA